jgi:SAM-dependent methyltransferase
MSVEPDYFAALYRRDSDPWRMRSSAYERDKYLATIALLPPRRFRKAVEIGCSVGVLTRMLADHCDNLLALDVDDLPLAQARETCGDCGNVSFEKRVVPAEWPHGTFDLTVLSEVLYFLDAQDIAATAQKVAASASRDALVVLVNWLGPTGTPCDGETAAELFVAASQPAFVPQTQRRTREYRMDVLVRP